MNAIAKKFVKFLLVILVVVSFLYLVVVKCFNAEADVHVIIDSVECLESHTIIYYTIENYSENRTSFLRVVVTAVNIPSNKPEHYQVKLTDGILGKERRKASIAIPRYDCNATDFSIEAFTF